MDRLPSGPGFAVYVHWPFCASKCPYCDFNSHVRHGGIDERRFREAYLTELRHTANAFDRAPVRSIFLGGGTPSLMPVATVAAILTEIGALWPLEANCEITLEANPGSVEAERFRGYRQAGVNRVSLGLQALGDRDLKILGRLHTADEARRALATAFETFDRVSFDLIYARPGQTADDWRRELEMALALQPSHLSLYQLTIEDGTPFADLHARGRLRTPASEDAAELYEITQELCEARGLPAYEVSNHARPGEECSHNLVYWRYGTYAGVGAGAHGRVRRDGQRFATATERNPERWLDLVERQGQGCIEDAALSLEEQAHEQLMMSMRLSEGVDLDRLGGGFGFTIDRVSVDQLVRDGLLQADAEGKRLAATPSGRQVLNHLVVELAAAMVPVAGNELVERTAARSAAAARAHAGLNRT